MNNINSIIHQQTHLITQNSALRKAASAPQPPNLTKDESQLINQKFAASKPMQSYSMDGSVNQHHIVRGANFDARV